MKRIILAACIILGCDCANAQVYMNANVGLNPLEKPVYNPYQFPNYYQNNASYVDNSMQNNRPSNPNAGPFTGNGDYTNPTMNVNGPVFYGNQGNQVVIPVYNNTMNAPFGTNTNTVNVPVNAAPINIMRLR